MSLPRYVPVDALPQSCLVADWLGPVCWPNSHAPGGMQLGMLFPFGVLGWVMSDGITVDSAKTIPATFKGMLLDALRSEVLHRVVDVLARGEVCPNCKGKGWVDALASGGWGQPKCMRCDGEKWARRPYPHVRSFLPLALGGEAGEEGEGRPDHVAALLVRSVERVARGTHPVLGVLPPWETKPDWPGYSYRSANSYEWACMVGPEGWAYAESFDEHIKGEATGDAGRAAADQAALDDGMALLDPAVEGGLRLPP